jgi:hypothetical protein
MLTAKDNASWLTAKDNAVLERSVRAMDALVSQLRSKIAIIDGLRASISSAYDHLPADRDDDLRSVLSRHDDRLGRLRTGYQKKLAKWVGPDAL